MKSRSCGEVEYSLCEALESSFHFFSLYSESRCLSLVRVSLGPASNVSENRLFMDQALRRVVKFQLESLR